MKIQCLLIWILLKIILGKQCYRSQELDLFSLGAICHGTPSLPDLPCGHAFDYNPATIWHPPRQENQFYELTLNRRVGLTYIELLQNKVESV